MWVTAWFGLAMVPASLRHSGLLFEQHHRNISLWVALTPWLIISLALLFGTISQFEDSIFRRRVIAGLGLGLCFPAIGLLIHYAWPTFRITVESPSSSIWLVYWFAYLFSVNPLHGAGPWVDRWLNKWLGPGDVWETTTRAREREIREAATQEERNRLAQDLHDSIKQEIFAIHTNAATIEARLGTDPDGARIALGQIRNSSRDAMTEMEALLDRLHATPLENTGLVAALRKQCEALALRTGAHVDCEIGNLPDSKRLPPGAHEALFRIAQEALSNIGKHARATKVLLRLDVAERDLQLTIEDNGQGFDRAKLDSSRSGMGLANMRKRAAAVGGRFELTTSPGKGTALRVSVIVMSKLSFGLTDMSPWMVFALGATLILPVVGFLAVLVIAPDLDWKALAIFAAFIGIKLYIDHVRRKRAKTNPLT